MKKLLVLLFGFSLIVGAQTPTPKAKTCNAKTYVYEKVPDNAVQPEYKNL